jgi:hypothetical protein
MAGGASTGENLGGALAGLKILRLRRVGSETADQKRHRR